uniref:NADH-ubiquinone oxidoreductase chain 4L n=1 Tax=Pnyxia scabiei TaxID=1781627 RepID=A0A7L9R579_9DIPT|nr:NADH dehydrogenase subunit 4L [Pnyxia scabiei]QOL10549.1 NADH dehydrogenase subunit 4L [Pnyxia scabiei]
MLFCMSMFTDLIIYVVLFMFIMGAISFFVNQKFLLLMLLSLEFMVLSLFILLFIYLKVNFTENYFLMGVLVFNVCEGALGLSLLVSMIRTHGNNFFQVFNI